MPDGTVQRRGVAAGEETDWIVNRAQPDVTLPVIHG